MRVLDRGSSAEDPTKDPPGCTCFFQMRFSSFARLGLAVVGLSFVSAQEPGGTAIAGDDFGDFVEKDFPFFSSTLDCRDLGEGFPKDNLTPRGLILNLGHNVWACFDIDLLRIACIWEGEPGHPPITMNALAPGSYHVAGQKTKDGQEVLPKPIGKVWLANGIYPGWQVGETPSFEDPREPAPTKEEVGRGPLPSGMGRFDAILWPFTSEYDDPAWFALSYEIGGTKITEAWSPLAGNKQFMRTFTVSPHSKSLLLLLGTEVEYTDYRIPWVRVVKSDGQLMLSVDASEDEQRFALRGTVGRQWELEYAPLEKPQRGAICTFPESVTTHADPPKPTDSGESYMIDNIPIPVPNPWRRNVRLADIDFLDDHGNAVAVTMDGDVWRVSGLKGDLAEVTWNRFASGLHEPMSIVVRPDPQVAGGAADAEANPWARLLTIEASLNENRAKLGRVGELVKMLPCADDVKAAIKAGNKPEVADWLDSLPKPEDLVDQINEAKRAIAELENERSTLVKGAGGLSPSIFVFDRNGIWKLVDTNGDGECDRHEMFCNLFAQTAETREFPNSMKLGPDGSFYIAKGGQEGTTRGKHNGTVIRVAPDGKSFEVIGYGLRQPFIGVNPVTGLVTASDQQGHYVPSTPIHIIGDHRFYGHLPSIAEPEKYPETIAEPLTWIPHPVNSSGATQVWASDERMGPIFGEMIHVGYNRPELFRVVMNSRFERPQAAVMSFTRDLDFGPLNAKVNPADGQLYVVGFQIWGTTATKLSGLARVRYTGKPRVLVTEVTPMDKGVLLKFNAKLDPKLAIDPANYSGERWNYQRTEQYGSPHLKPDGETGQEWMTASSAYLSDDGMSVMIGFPDMKAGVHQMRIGWGLKSADGLPAQNAAYLSPWELATFDSTKEGFGDIEVDLTPRKVEAAADAVASVEEGEKLYLMFGCMACHSIDGTLQGKVGPSWKGLFGSEREIAKGEKGKFPADEAYLRESILNPSAKVVKGFEKFDTGMPIYAGILNDAQIESLILYIKSLK